MHEHNLSLRNLLTWTAMVLLALSCAAPGAAKEGGYIDGHLHFVGQFMPGQSSQKGKRQDRRPPHRRPPGRGGEDESGGKRRDPSASFTQEDFITCADNMIALMDKYGIEKAVVMPQPRIKDQPGFYDFRQIVRAVRKYPGRLYLGGGGGKLNAMIHGTDADRVTDRVRGKFALEAMAIVKAGAKVFGELSALHLSLHAKHAFEEVAPDHPLYLLLADIAAKQGLPIDIHMEGVLKDMPTPANLLKISTKNPKTLKANIPAFERLLKHNRKAIIIWQHIGWDNVGHMTPTLLRRLIKDHPNLYLGFKIEDRPFQVGSGGKPMPNRMVDRDYKIKPEWMEFFKDAQDRLISCCDQFVGIPGKTRHWPSYLKETYPTMKQLPADVRRKVCRENAIRVYRLE